MKLGWFRLIIICILGIALAAFFFREQFGEYLVVDEAPRPVDLIVVLSGNQYRVDKAIVLYQHGYARKILVSGAEPLQVAYMLDKAIRAGIPRSNLDWESVSKNTYQNAYYSCEYMRKNNFKTALLVTSDYHSRRVYNCFNSIGGQALEFIVCAKHDLREYNPRYWWSNPTWLRHFLDEYTKLALYATGLEKYR